MYRSHSRLPIQTEILVQKRTMSFSTTRYKALTKKSQHFHVSNTITPGVKTTLILVGIYDVVLHPVVFDRASLISNLRSVPGNVLLLQHLYIMSFALCCLR